MSQTERQNEAFKNHIHIQQKGIVELSNAQYLVVKNQLFRGGLVSVS